MNILEAVIVLQSWTVS